jgi:hypothetical protein
MGIAPQAAGWILDHCGRSLHGRCLTLGRQDILMTIDQFWGVLHSRGVIQITGPGQITVGPHQGRAHEKALSTDTLLSSRPDLRAKGFISDTFFFEFLGFDDFKSLDASAYEGADYIFDLNSTGIREVIGEGVDLVLDAGTMEHIFKVDQVLANIFDSLNIDGWIVHQSPTSNYVNHGYYQFSPCFFAEYYSANRFDNILVELVREGRPQTDDAWMMARYHGEGTGTVHPGSLDDRQYCTFVRAQKTVASTCGVVPQQGVYLPAWSAAAA